MSNNEDAGDLDDFMDSIGLDVKPASPEDAIIIRLTGQGVGSMKYREIHNLRFWLIHEIYAYHNLIEEGCVMVRESAILKKQVPFTKEDFARTRIKYWLQMKYLPYFTSDMNGLGAADLDKTCELVLATDEISRVLSCSKDDLPKMHYTR